MPKNENSVKRKREHKCVHCDTGFFTLTDKTKHEKICRKNTERVLNHRDNKILNAEFKFQCHKCPKQYLTLQGLYFHRIKKHGHNEKRKHEREQQQKAENQLSSSSLENKAQMVEILIPELLEKDMFDKNVMLPSDLIPNGEILSQKLAGKNC